MDIAYIPSPSTGVIHLGPIPLRGYAFAILVGIFIAVWLGGRRWEARGGKRATVADIGIWAVPFGLVGGRLYHVITTYEPYFGKDGDWVDAFKIWEGGLGIWGAIALGALGAWIGCRRRGIPMPAYADAVAPGIALAQGVGRVGNWFNQELYGKATDLPWALKIDKDHAPSGVAGTYHPTFLYELLWDVGVAGLVIWADRRFKLGHGRAFALYVAAYTAGRFWVEYLRIDEAHHVLGLRLNDWTSIVVFAAAAAYFVISAKIRPGREAVVEPGAQDAAPEAAETAGGESAEVSLEKSADEAAAAKTDDAAAEPDEAAAVDPDSPAAVDPDAPATAEPDDAVGAQPDTPPAAAPETSPPASPVGETRQGQEADAPSNS